VFHNPSTGRYWQASPRLYQLAAAFDGRISVADAIAALPAEADPDDREALLAGLSGMIGAGLLRLPGARPPPPMPSPWTAPLRRAVFARVPLGDLGRVLPVAEPLLGWLFTRAGSVLLAALLAIAAWSWSGREAEIAAQFVRLGALGADDLILGYLVFAAAKLLHEVGHAVAVRRMAAAEGHAVAVIPWGVSFMFLMPAPYVDVSAAWFVGSAWRRAAIGLGGIATDLLVAALAALGWAAVGPGALHDRLFDLVLICGASSLLFNLNPLVRLDGYHVLSDLLGIENLAARAQAALGRVALGPFGLAAAPRWRDAPGAAWTLASWGYRWTIYLGIFWIAGGVHWLLAAAVAAVVLSVFVALPLAQAARRLGREGWRGAAVAVSVAFVAALAALLPLPAAVIAEGVVLRDGLALVYARADARVVAVAPPGTGTGDVVLRLDNPETDRRLTQLAADAAALEIESRRARAEAASDIDAAAERRRAVAEQAASLRAEQAGWIVVAPPGAVWEPLRAWTLPGGWVRRDDSRPLGAVLGGDGVEIRLVLDQWDGPAALAALAAAPDRPIALRLRGPGPASFAARPIAPAAEARDALPSAALADYAGGRIPAQADARGEARPTERVFELRLRPDPGALPPLAHGGRVEAWIALPPAPLLDQAWRRGRQILQRRLAV